MVTLQLTIPPLEAGRIHESSYYQIAKENTFDNILLNIENDTINLTSVRSNLELEDGTTYFARAKFATDPGGLSAWSEVFEFIASDSNEYELLYNYPTLAEVPRIETIFDRDSHPETMFEIKLLTDYKFTNNNYVKANWLIEDIDGKIAFSSLDNEVGLDSIYFNDHLEPGVYTLKLAVELASGDISDFGSYVINVDEKDVNDFFIKDYLTKKVSGFPISMTTSIPEGFDFSTVKVYNDGVVVEEFITSNAFIDLDGKIPDNFHSIVAVQANYLNGKKSPINYRYVINDNISTLPGNLPYELW